MTGALPYSVLDLSPVKEGATPADAFRESLGLARHTERLGYKRYWIAEHHNFPGIASSATAVLLAHIGGGTSTIRIGAGGIMLPNHAPLTIAEQFGTLATLFPGRVDLGLGRAPGGDRLVAAALRRGLGDSTDRFPDEVEELRGYFRPPAGRRAVRAIPGEGLEIPLYLLGSSDYGARLAARLGLPYAFASHFAPAALDLALRIYRDEFRPSSSLKTPYVLVTVNVFAADSDDEGERLFSSHRRMVLGLVRGVPGRLQPPVDDMDALWSPEERDRVEAMTRFSVVGSPASVRRGFEAIVKRTGADEIIVSGQIFDHQARLRSLGIAAGALASFRQPHPPIP